MQNRLNVLAVAAGLVLVTTACGSDLTGLEDLDEYAGELAAHLEVAAVRCDDSRISTTGSTSCVAYGRNGQILENIGTPLVMWSTPDTAVARVDLSGRVVAVGVGMAQVIARGSRGSTASSDVVVE